MLKNDSVMCPHCHDVFEISLLALVRKQNSWCRDCEREKEREANTSPTEGSKAQEAQEG